MKKLIEQIYPHRKMLQSGGANNGIIFVVAILATLVSFSYILMGGTLPDSPGATTDVPDNLGKQEIIFEQVQDPKKKNLQLQTFTVKNTCESKIAVNFLIDVSGSMGFGGGAKLNEEKNALRAFTARMVDDSVIGMQTFSRTAQEVVEISYYKDVRLRVQNAINSLTPLTNTQTKDGLILSQRKLKEAIDGDIFPNYKYFLVFLTDGIPETADPNEQNCIATAIRDDGQRRCFARDQDPRIPTNIASQIKNMGVEIYSINITSAEKSDVELAPHLEALLKDVASDPVSEHYFTSFNGADLTAVLDQVFKNICS